MIIRYEYKMGSGTEKWEEAEVGSDSCLRVAHHCAPVPIANKSRIKVPLFGDGYSPSSAEYTAVRSGPYCFVAGSKISFESYVGTVSRPLRLSSVFLSTRRWNGTWNVSSL